MRMLAFLAVGLCGLAASVGGPASAGAVASGAVHPNQVAVGATLSIGDVSLYEGNSGTKDFVFAVTLSFPVAVGVTVDFSTAEGTATVADNDYVPTSGTATIPAFQTSAMITVQVNGDATPEGDEDFYVNLSNSNAKILDGQGVGAILDDDPPTISISNVSLAEGDAGTTAFNFVVLLSSPSAIDVMVDYATVSSTAAAGIDYQSVSGTATIPAGSTSTVITVLVNGDTDIESLEQFFVLLSNPSLGSFGNNPGAGNILNDDGIVAVGDLSVTEFALGRVAPNPSRGMTRIDYALPRASNVRLSILDVQGREVAVLAEGWRQPGRYQATWDGRVGNGTAPAGVYFLRYHTPVRNFVERIVLVR